MFGPVVALLVMLPGTSAGLDSARLGTARDLLRRGRVEAEQLKLSDATRDLEEASQILADIGASESEEAGMVFADLGRISRQTGDYATARRDHELALAVRRKLAIAPAERDEQVWDSLNSLLIVEMDQGDLAAAEKTGREGLKLCDEKASLHRLVSSLNGLGMAVYSAGRYVEAASLYGRAVEIQKRLPESLTSAALELNLGILDGALGKRDEEEKLLLHALAVRTRLLGPDHPDVVRVSVPLAEVDRALDRNAEAEARLRVAAEKLEKALGPASRDLGITLSALGAALTAQNRYAEAETIHQRAVAILEPLASTAPVELAHAVFALGYVQIRATRCADAERNFRRAIAIDEAARGRDFPELAEFIADLGYARVCAGAPLEALPLIERAIEISRRSSAESCAIGDHLMDLAGLEMSLGHPSEAEENIVEARKYLRGTRQDADARLLLASILERQDRFGEAEKLFRELLGEFATSPRRLSMELGVLHNNFAVLLDEDGRIAEAETEYRLALKTLSPGDSIIAPVCSANLGRLLMEASRDREAEPLIRGAISTLTAQLGPNHPSVAIAVLDLAILQLRRGETQVAQGNAARALTIFRKSIPDTRQIPDALNVTAEVASEEGRRLDAAKALAQAAFFRVRTRSAHSRDISETQALLAGMLARDGKLRSALALFDSAIAIEESSARGFRATLGSLLVRRSAVERKLGQLKQADDDLLRATGIFRVSAGTVTPLVADTLELRAEVLRERGHETEAAACESAADSIRRVTP